VRAFPQIMLREGGCFDFAPSHWRIQGGPGGPRHWPKIGAGRQLHAAVTKHRRSPENRQNVEYRHRKAGFPSNETQAT